MPTNASTTTSVTTSSTSCPCTLHAQDTEAVVSVGAGTFTGVAGKVQASHDGTDYFDWPSYDVHGAFRDAGTTITLTNSTAAFLARAAGLGGMAKVRFLATGYSTGSAPVTVATGVWGTNGGVPATQAGAAATPSSLTSSGAIKSTSASGGVGYATGAGGAVTQGTDKSTAVTLNTVTGAITLNNASLADATTVSFTLTNSAIAATDFVGVHHASAGTGGSYICWADTVAGGSCKINVRNVSGGSLGEAIVLRFVVIKGVSS